MKYEEYKSKLVLTDEQIERKKSRKGFEDYKLRNRKPFLEFGKSYDDNYDEYDRDFRKEHGEKVEVILEFKGKQYSSSNFVVNPNDTGVEELTLILKDTLNSLLANTYKP